MLPSNQPFNLLVGLEKADLKVSHDKMWLLIYNSDFI